MRQHKRLALIFPPLCVPGSGNASKVFPLNHRCLEPDIHRREKLQRRPHNLIIGNSRVWPSGSDLTRRGLPSSNPMGWDFMTPGSPSISLSDTHLHTPHFNLLDEPDRTRRDHLELRTQLLEDGCFLRLRDLRGSAPKPTDGGGSGPGC